MCGLKHVQIPVTALSQQWLSVSGQAKCQLQKHSNQAKCQMQKQTQTILGPVGRDEQNIPVGRPIHDGNTTPISEIKQWSNLHDN